MDGERWQALNPPEVAFSLGGDAIRRNAEQDALSAVYHTALGVSTTEKEMSMSHYMTALAMKQKGLKPAAKIVLYWIADHHNGETGACFPSHKRLAEVCEMTDRSIRNQIDILKQMGLIEVIDRKRPNGSQTSNAYCLMLKDDTDRKNIPTPQENISATPVQNFPTHNLVNNNLGKELLNNNDHFEDFWAAYPRKVAKGNARKAFAAAMKKATIEEISAGLNKQLAALSKKERQYIPHASTWLNGERWNDEPTDNDEPKRHATIDAIAFAARNRTAPREDIF